jgi:hypothetical protein
VPGLKIPTADAYRGSGMRKDLVPDAAIGRGFTSHPQLEFCATVGLTWTALMPPGNAAIEKHLKEERHASSESLVSWVA